MTDGHRGETEKGLKSGRGIILEASLDGPGAQFHEYLRERLLENGARDVSFIPVLSGKNLMGTLLRAIVQEKDADSLTEWILQESAAWEVCIHKVEHRGAAAKWLEVETSYGKVRVKESGGDKFHPEYEDCRRLAMEKKVPIQEVYREALGTLK
jgi:pyridinium-3,5-bisthiocarboxylic acid mononucleotide nickel chelatase